jgi:hypothetical protein
MRDIPDHPEIECAMRTGYPSWGQEEDNRTYCGECGCELDDEDNVYTTDHYEFLCEDCLKMLHRKAKLCGVWV